MNTPDPKRLLQRIVDELLEELPGLRAIVLFGSFAKGAAGAESDIDLLVVGDFARVEGCEVSHRPLDGRTVEITVLGVRAFLDDLRRGRPFALSVIRDGEVLYDAGVMARMRRAAAPAPGKDFILSYLALAKQRLAQGDLRAAATSIINARRLLRNDVSLSSHLESLLPHQSMPDPGTLRRWVRETEQMVGSESFA